MKRLLIIAALVAGAAALLAACGGGGGDNGATAASGSMGAGTVSAKKVGDAGNVLVDSSGQALYASDQEKGGKVLCTGACNSFWKPLTVSGAPKRSSVPGKLGVAKRPDGARQVTFNGKLLYSFSEDKTGEVTGDGFDDAFSGRQFTWHVVHAGGSAGSSHNMGSSGDRSPAY
jgi:predicted lipoprotein with Yx(FWY)xxD motif